jgi:hypothetical protein
MVEIWLALRTTAAVPAAVPPAAVPAGATRRDGK